MQKFVHNNNLRFRLFRANTDLSPVIGSLATFSRVFSGKYIVKGTGVKNDYLLIRISYLG